MCTTQAILKFLCLPIPIVKITFFFSIILSYCLKYDEMDRFYEYFEIDTDYSCY